jgi:hypothetical protein
VSLLADKPLDFDDIPRSQGPAEALGDEMSWEEVGDFKFEHAPFKDFLVIARSPGATSMPKFIAHSISGVWVS